MTKTFFLLVSLLAISEAKAQDMRPEVNDSASFHAYKEFWTSFDDYESNAFAKGKAKYLENWHDIQKEWKSQENELNNTQIETLRLAIQRYQSHLTTHGDTGTVPYVRLNLAQALFKLGTHQRSQGEASKKRALAVISDLTRENPSFAMTEEALYLKASILESLDQEESAHNVWKTLAAQAKSTIYGVHAHLALGDHAFAKEQAETALASYRKAYTLTQSLNLPIYEKIRVDYRLAWASYRAADLDSAMDASRRLLEPEADFRQISMQKKMTKDACDLIGDSLFEKDNIAQTKSYLKRESIRPFAAVIGLKMMTRMATNPSSEKMSELGEFLLERYPQAKEVPEVAILMADIYKKERQQEKYIATLERLSLLLPKNSLWRVQHKGDLPAIAAMERKALEATQLLAGQFYEDGLVQKSASSFATSQTYYDVLLRFDPENSDAETWELRRAHCMYFANDWEAADKAYEAFKSRSQAKSENLEIAYYQQILGREKLWRQSLSSLSTEKTNRTQSEKRLQALEQGIDDFTDRFPNRSHGVDLLLVAANANRDLGNSKQADRYWNRALLSEPNATQRTLAIRGLVQSKVKAGDPQELLALTRNYLKLEDFSELGAKFNSELYSVLSSSIRDAAKELNDKGKILEAGQLMIAMAREFPEIPEQKKIYRDGSYYLALAGAWGETSTAANSYLAEHKKSEINADMMYLKARSEEYQLRFGDAAKSHLALAETHPKFSRTVASLQRSEELASGEEDYRTAGRAAMIASSYKKDPEQKHEGLLHAAEYYAKDGDWDDSMKALTLAEKASNSPGLKMKTQLMMAKVWEGQGDREKALATYQKLAQEAESMREDLDKQLYSRVVGEANFLLGEAEAKRSYRVDELESADAVSQIRKKDDHIDRSLKFYNKAIAADDSEWSARARYGAASLAEGMSQSIRNAIAKRKVQGSDTLKEQAQRWQTLAQQYHSQNLLARQKDPSLNNAWIERSALKISGLQPIPETKSSDVPASLDTTQPYQWSH